MQLKQAIKQSKGIRVTVCDSDGRITKFYISKKNARDAYHDELFNEIDFLNTESFTHAKSKSDVTTFEFDEEYCGFLNIHIG